MCACACACVRGAARARACVCVCLFVSVCPCCVFDLHHLPTILEPYKKNTKENLKDSRNENNNAK